MQIPNCLSIILSLSSLVAAVSANPLPTTDDAISSGTEKCSGWKLCACLGYKISNCDLAIPVPLTVNGTEHLMLVTTEDNVEKCVGDYCKCGNLGAGFVGCLGNGIR